jgi:hypothetical protein
LIKNESANQIAHETGFLVNFLEAGYIFSHGPFQELINGAKMALNI